jgi:regulator of chromosome condensation
MACFWFVKIGLPSQDARFQPEVSDGFKGHRWLSISCGQHHTLALDEDGK